MTYTPKTYTTSAIAGEQSIYEFPNGWGASVIRGSFTYGGNEGLWELAVLNPEGEIDYTTHITDDVIGHLTQEQVQWYLAEIEELPAYGTGAGTAAGTTASAGLRGAKVKIRFPGGTVEVE